MDTSTECRSLGWLSRVAIREELAPCAVFCHISDKAKVITSGHNCFLYPRAARTAQNGARTCPTKVTSHKTQVTRRFRTCSKQGLASRTDGRPLARIIAHKMSAWVPHRKHTRHRRAVHAPARAEARRRRDIERGRVAERLRPRTTTSRLTCAESSASEFLEGPSRGPRATGPSLGPRHGEQTRGLHGLGSRPEDCTVWGADPRTARFGEQTRGLHRFGGADPRTA
jgi:hypothetical protein